MNIRILIAIAGLAAAGWSYRNWRKAVLVAMVLVVLEGAMRKWLFPQAQDLIYFAKDLFLLGAYVGFFAQKSRWRHRIPQTPALFGPLLLAATYGAIQVANPNLPNPVVGAFGFKAYFFYVPLIFLLPAAIPSSKVLRTLLRRYALLAIPVGLLAIAQFFSPASSFLNTYARSSPGGTHIATFGSSGFVRVTSTFSYITGYSTYLSAMAFLLLALLAAARWRFRGQWKVYLALGITVLGMILTGSRAPLMMLALLFPLYWWLAVVRERQGAATFGRVLLGIGLVAGLVGFAAPDAVDAFYGRATNTSDVPGRMISPLIQPVRTVSDAGVFGFGIGAAHQSAPVLAKSPVPYSWLNGLIVEQETGKVMLELGLIGFVLVYFIRVYLVFFAFGQTRRLRVPFHRAVATSSLLFFLAQLPGGVVFNVTSGVYYWFFAGLLLLVMRLDREAVAAARQASEPVITGAAVGGRRHRRIPPSLAPARR